MRYESARESLHPSRGRFTTRTGAIEISIIVRAEQWLLGTSLDQNISRTGGNPNYSDEYLAPAYHQ